MEILFYLMAMIGGSIQYDFEWFLSLVSVCIGTSLLIAFIFGRRCSNLKTKH
jgi:hypothetical protein